MLFQRRDASAPRFGRAAAGLPKALDPDDRRAGTDLKLLRRLAPRRSVFHFRNHSLPHVPRIGPRPRQPPKSESMPVDSPILRPMRILLIQLARNMLIALARQVKSSTCS